MRLFALTSTAWPGEILLSYNDLGLLENLDSSGATLSEQQQIWFLKNMPRELAELQKLMDKAPSATLREIVQEVTFEMFWNKYDEKVRSSKKKTQAIWNRLTKTNRVKAYNFISRYEGNLNPGVAKKYAETYLNAELWNN